MSLSLSNEIPPIQGSHGEYYECNGVNYDIHFPVDWACKRPEPDGFGITEEELDEFGHNNCLNCLDYGYYNGVVIGYCANCASLLNYTRGNGMISVGLEITSEYSINNTEYLDENSMWNGYMQNTDLDKIGDVGLAELHADKLCRLEKYWENYWKNKSRCISEENKETDDDDDEIHIDINDDNEEISFTLEDEENDNYLDYIV